MPTEDEMLERVQRRATAIRRRQRLLVGGAAAVVVVALLGGAVVAGTVGDDREPAVDVADAPTTTTPTTEADAPQDACDALATDPQPDPDLGPDTSGPDGSPTASTDGRDPSGSRPAQGDPAGVPPAESSIPPDDPPAVSAGTVEATSTTCPLHIRVNATYRTDSRLVDLTVTATAEASYEADGFVVWDAADPVQVDLGAIERSPGSCDATTGADTAAVAPVQGVFQASHTYPTDGDKVVTVTFWAQRCGGPVHQVEVAVTVPL